MESIMSPKSSSQIVLANPASHVENSFRLALMCSVHLQRYIQERRLDTQKVFLYKVKP